MIQINLTSSLLIHKSQLVTYSMDMDSPFSLPLLLVPLSPFLITPRMLPTSIVPRRHLGFLLSFLRVRPVSWLGCEEDDIAFSPGGI